jgi:hypothetical protein
MMFKDEWKGWLLIVLGPFALALVPPSSSCSGRGDVEGGP